MGESYRVVRVVEEKPSFLKRHGRWVSVTGAFIVFGTFIAKDAMKDQLKELIDSINSSEASYSSRSDIAQVDMELTAVLHNLDSIESRVKVHRTQPGIEGTDAIIYFDGAISESEMIISRSEELAAQLPERDRFLKQIATFSRELDKERDSEKERAKTTSRDPDKLFSDGLRIFGAINYFAASVVEAAAEEKEREEKRYRFWTWASYVLYTTGWSLALFGRIFGIGDVLAAGG